MEKSKVNRALAVASEVIGCEMTPEAVKLMVMKLAVYPESWVMGAIDRCVHELRHKLTLADVIDRLADGRPGPEEAWAMLPRDEQTTTVWTQEMSKAWGICLPILDSDPVQARMAFLEAYKKALGDARRAGELPRWQPSLGTDPAGREGPLREAVRLGRLPGPQVDRLLPSREISRQLPATVERSHGA